MGTVLTTGAVETWTTFLMSRMFGKTNTPKKGMTGIKIVETRVTIRAKNGTEGKIQSEVEAVGGITGIEVGRGTRTGEAEAQDDIMIVTGMTDEGQEHIIIIGIV